MVIVCAVYALAAVALAVLFGSLFAQFRGMRLDKESSFFAVNERCMWLSLIGAVALYVTGSVIQPILS